MKTTDDATGRQVRNGHGLAPFLPNNRTINPNLTARSGYRDGAGFFGVQLETRAPHTLSHAGFTTNGTNRIPFFKSAGNYDKPDTARDALDCNVGAPGASIAAFTVAVRSASERGA